MDNEDSASQGEFEDHISKKGHTYRTEHYDDSGNLFLLTIRKWNTLQLADADTENDRFFSFLERETSVTYDGFSSGRTTLLPSRTINMEISQNPLVMEVNLQCSR